MVAARHTSFSVAGSLLLLPPSPPILLEALSDSSCRSLSCCVPHLFIAQNIGGELCLGLGNSGPCSSVVSVYLGQHKEVREGRSGEPESDEEVDEPDEVVSSVSSICSSATPEGYDCGDEATSTGVRDTKSHDDGETELAEENEEEDHEVEGRVVPECLVGRSEPTEEGERDEEEAVDESESEHGSIVESSEQEAGTPEQVD